MGSVRRPLLVVSVLLVALGLLLTVASVADAQTPPETQELTLTASAVSSTEIRLDFTASITYGAGGSHFQIRYREAGQTSYGGPVLVPITRTDYTVSGLKPGTDYEFEIRACTDEGNNTCGNFYGSAAEASARTSSPTAGVSVSETSLSVAEGGSSTYTVTLDSAPQGDVVISVLAAGNSDVTVDTDAPTDGDQSTLTFTTENYSTPQTVTVSAAQDDDAADETATVTHSVVASQSSDEYDGVSIDSVSVAVTDDDTAGVTVSESSLSVVEGHTATYTVTLDAQPAGNVRISVSSDDDSVTVAPAAFTLTAGNWQTGRTVTVTAVDDADTDAESVTVTHVVDAAATTADEYDSVSVASVAVSVADDDVPIDYDADGDRLIEITAAAQLNVMRWDLDGDGTPAASGVSAYEAAFRHPQPNMGCGAAGCLGYELMNDIALSGSWTPIGGNIALDVFSGDSYTARFDGNGYSISGLRISLGSRKWVGLFGATSSTAAVSRVALEGVSVVGDSLVGALVGNNAGMVTESYVTGRVSAGSGDQSAFIGGLVGNNTGTVSKSYSEAVVSGMSLSGRIGGLVGRNADTVRDSYASGRVMARSTGGGLVGENVSPHAMIVNSYSTAAVSGEFISGGLIGVSQATVTASYFDTETSGQSDAAGIHDEPGGAARSTTELQSPTGATGIYATWDPTIWDFGDSSDYPRLRGDHFGDQHTTTTTPITPPITGGGGGGGGGGPVGGGGGPTEPAARATPRFEDVDADSVHAGAIAAIAEAGITRGCDAAGSRYCPDQAVTRAQMASFLARALDLPATATDYFSDDDNSSHEANINALRAAGITRGCDTAGSRYCPDQAVTRAQMASFLARALDLPATATDYFSDDDGSSHEANINALRAAGITRGCDPDRRRFCPDQLVTRAQMATFLARALNLT